jgi:cytochrome c peroxidase
MQPKHSVSEGSVFYHDGRFATLLDVVNHYNTVKSLGLTEDEKQDLIAYLMSL